MTNRKPLHLFFAIVLVIFGAVLGYAVARDAFVHIVCIRAGIPLDGWDIGRVGLFALLGAFCVWVGANQFKRATGQQVRKQRFRWGRLLTGAFIVFYSLKSWIRPSANALKADNDAQAQGMLMFTACAVILGLVIMAFSFKQRKQASIDDQRAN